MPRSKTSDLIAPSLANLPNALDADYWLKKVQIQEQLGMYKVTEVLLALSSPVQHYFSLVCIHLVCFLLTPDVQSCRQLWISLSLL